MRALVFVYGVVSYVLFLGVFLYTVGFLVGEWVPRGMDDSAPIDLGAAIVVNLVLLTVFAVQHTVMARPAFKRWVTQFIPPAAERSTFVMVTNLLLIGLFVFWQPMPDIVWSTEGALANMLWVAYALGWATVLVSTFLIDHFDLFGLRQVTTYLRGQEYRGPRFVERGLYRVVRHPIMLGFLVAFWAAPEMSQGRLLFAIMTSAYVMVAVRIEEATLVDLHGDSYRAYQRRVPGVLPFRRPRKG